FIPLILSVPRKYYLIQQGKTWSDAQAYCRATHTDLAIINSNDNMVRLQNEAQRQQFSSSAWLGLYNDINSWRWSMGNEPVTTMRWALFEPGNGGGRQECGAMSPLGWKDLACTLLHPSVCFDDGNTGNQRYIYISNTMTWHEAQAYCRLHHTDLASSKDAIEDFVIKGLSFSNTWIGLFRDSWKWNDQTNFSTISWMTGKPDNALGSENCGYLSNGQAADALCSDIMPFFCYSIITGQQQIVRVKVQSNEDVNDPAVKEVILDQETRWKGSKARSIGAGFKLFYYGVDSKRNGVGIVLKEGFVRNVLEVKRVSDRVMSLKLEIEGVMLEEKERFWSELDEVMESIPTGERVVIEADFNGHVGKGNTGDEEVMGKFGVKERNLEGQMVVDFAKRMDMAVVNTYFQKREEHRELVQVN
ncbi:hypothetical protein QTP86_031908, partial [Hemibagrus guttatus]